MGRRIKSVVFCCIVFPCLILIAFPLNSFAQSSLKGDLNEDSRVNIFDLLEMLKVLSNGPQSDRQKQLANVNESADGKVDIFDLLALLRVLSGQPTDRVRTPTPIRWTHCRNPWSRA